MHPLNAKALYSTPSTEFLNTETLKTKYYTNYSQNYCKSKANT